MPYERQTRSQEIRLSHLPSTSRRLLSALTAVAVVASVAATAATASAQANRKAAPACGIKYLPMVPGTEWVYDYVPPPPPKEGEPEQLPLVFPPKSITIKVVSVTPPKKGKRGPTEIVLEETTEKLVHKTTLQCTGTELAVSPQSFFFAGEPGGGVQVELSNIHRTGKSYPGARGFIRAQTFELTLTADVKRSSAEKITLDPVSLSVTRTLTHEGQQKVSGPAGEFKATRIRLEVSGKVKLNNKETLFPRNVPGALWFADGVGLVQSYNTLGQQYRLNKTTIPLKKK